MKKYLITLLIIPTLIFADAVIFSGSDVKTLKPNIDLFGVTKILTTSTIPTAGLVAPKGSIAMYTTTGDLYLKTGALNTDWTKNQTGPVNLATDVTGILPIANGGTGSATQNFVDLTTAQNIAGLKTFTDALTVDSSSASSLAVGLNGSTNPAFVVDSSLASQAAGLKVTAGAAGSGLTMSTISSGTNEAMNITTKGSGQLSLQVGGASKFTSTQIQNSFSQAASTSAATSRFLVTGVADTALTASTEAPHTYFNIGQTRQHATGALTLQRDFRIAPSTHSFVGASTLTNAAAFSVDGPSNGGTNATITNSSALYIPTSALTNVTNSYGLNVAASTGATNNYAGIFTGGNVGIGTTTPSTTLDVNGPITSAGAMAAYYQFASIFSGGFNVYKRGTTGDATASLTSGTELGYNAFYGWDGSAYGRGAFVLATTTEAWSGTGHGSYYSIWTTPTGSTTNAERMRIDQNGNVGIGVTSPNANAILDVTSTTKAFMPPRMTTAQKNAVASPTAGMVVYDTNMKGISFYNGTAWTTTNNKNVATKTANYTALQSDDVLLGDATSGAITITLPTAVGNTGEVFHIKKIDSSVNAVTIATTSSETIDGVTTQTLGVQYKNLTVVSNGVSWDIL